MLSEVVPLCRLTQSWDFPRCQFKWSPGCPSGCTAGPMAEQRVSAGRSKWWQSQKRPEAALRERRKKASSPRPETFTRFWHTVRNLQATTLYHHLVHTHVWLCTHTSTRVCMCLHKLKIFSWYSAIILHEMHWILFNSILFDNFKMWIKTH